VTTETALTCANCRWRQTGPVLNAPSLCHRMPPTPVVMPEQTPMGTAIVIKAAWPPVTASTVACAEHLPKTSTLS